MTPALHPAVPLAASQKGRKIMNTEHTRWRKASASYATGNCVQVASLPGGQIGVRDSKHPDGPVLSLTPRQWAALTAWVNDGESGPGA